jgi:hypothetical protein
VDGHFLVCEPCCSLTGAGAGEQQARRSLSVSPLGVEQTSRLGSRDRWPVGSSVSHMVARTTR